MGNTDLKFRSPKTGDAPFGRGDEHKTVYQKGLLVRGGHFSANPFRPQRLESFGMG
jgi:hypothetical protein